MSSFHVTFDQDLDELQLMDALSRSGLHTTRVRCATPIVHGYALTEMLADDLWQMETSTGCYCQCTKAGNGHRHLSWGELGAEQQKAFLNHLIDFLDDSRREHYEVEHLSATGLFGGVALQCDEDGA